jgi:hypothetical protein
MKRTWRWPLAGFVLGGLVGATFLTVNVVGAKSPDPVPVRASFGEILHTPALLAQAGEPVELSFDVVCGAAKDEPGGACSPRGSVFVRSAEASRFAELPLEREPDGLLSTVVPVRQASGGFDYYVEIDNGRGQSATLPEAAAEAPQHVWQLETWTTVELGAAQFGQARAPSAVIARLGWGKSDSAFGLDSGREQSRIGPSAFDVAPDGSVIVLDQVNHRLAVVRRGQRPAHLPIDFAGGEGDLAVGGDGTIYVLDSSGTPMVSAFTSAGDPVGATRVAEPVADMVRAGPSGPLVHAYPSEMWLPTGAGLPPLGTDQQLARAKPARSVAGGLGVVVRASPAEAKLALVRGDRVVHAWLLHSPTSFGEVQLAEPYGDGLLVVVRLWNEKQAEFRVLHLQPDGLASSFAVDTAEWAESASLSRFRLHGNTLYQLRSDPSGVEIATFQIGGMQ